MAKRFANAHPLVRLHDAAFEESHDYREQMKFKMMLYFNDECSS
ncbi:MAG: hypothetical protein OXT74_07880 [Candidatus Poribacteria bacterium]|nr:hypothetical protein [Candidatus Poribacteria bacterium]